jgi:hypothetical protein
MRLGVRLNWEVRMGGREMVVFRGWLSHKGKAAGNLVFCIWSASMHHCHLAWGERMMLRGQRCHRELARAAVLRRHSKKTLFLLTCSSLRAMND